MQLPLVPVYDTIVGYANILDDIHFEIDFTIHSWPSGDWGNIFQCGTANDIRYPGLFIHPDSGIEGDAQEGLYVQVTGGSNAGLMGNALELNVTYHVEVDFTQSSWTVVVNNETLRDAVSKSSHSVSLHMPCYSGFPNHDAADVTITALTMRSTSYDPIVGNYYVPNTTMSWSDGNYYCSIQYGTTLATITNDDDAQTLLDLFQQNGDYWIGLYDYTGDNAGWAWASGNPWFAIIHILSTCQLLKQCLLSHFVPWNEWCVMILSVMVMTAAH